jgi:hypothetical protein
MESNRESEAPVVVVGIVEPSLIEAMLVACKNGKKSRRIMCSNASVYSSSSSTIGFGFTVAFLRLRLVVVVIVVEAL